jgi:hypothetical protein
MLFAKKLSLDFKFAFLIARDPLLGKARRADELNVDNAARTAPSRA